MQGVTRGPRSGDDLAAFAKGRIGRDTVGNGVSVRFSWKTVVGLQVGEGTGAENSLTCHARLLTQPVISSGRAGCPALNSKPQQGAEQVPVRSWRALAMSFLPW
jgi:hypothetical protein